MSGDREDAKDLVQHTFLRAARRVAAIPDREPGAEAWLVRILVNLCRDRKRRLRVRARATQHVATGKTGGNPESIAVARTTVRKALAKLSPRRRVVLVLHELEDRDVKDIARLLGISRVTVRWHLVQAREQMRNIIQGPGYNDERIHP
jgi:RNA polymerase sigma-70 factor (ECF subfamily)